MQAVSQCKPSSFENEKRGFFSRADKSKNTETGDKNSDGWGVAFCARSFQQLTSLCSSLNCTMEELLSVLDRETVHVKLFEGYEAANADRIRNIAKLFFPSYFLVSPEHKTGNGSYGPYGLAPDGSPSCDQMVPEPPHGSGASSSAVAKIKQDVKDPTDYSPKFLF